MCVCVCVYLSSGVCVYQVITDVVEGQITKYKSRVHAHVPRGADSVVVMADSDPFKHAEINSLDSEDILVARLELVEMRR